MALENMDAQTVQELAALGMQLAGSPETRQQYLSLVKQVRPDLPMPELETSRRIDDATQKLRDEIAEMKAEQSRRDAAEEVARSRGDLVKRGLASEDDIAKIEEMMLKDGIMNYETAARYYQNQRQLAAPTPSVANSRAFAPLVNMNEFFKNPRTAAMNAADEVFRELRGQTRSDGL